MKDLVYSLPTDTIEVLRKRVENAVKTICNNRRMLENVEESFNKKHKKKISNVICVIWLICSGVSDKLSSAFIFKHQMRK
jgi:hypothetical protein